MQSVEQLWRKRFADIFALDMARILQIVRDMHTGLIRYGRIAPVHVHCAPSISTVTCLVSVKPTVEFVIPSSSFCGRRDGSRRGKVRLKSSRGECSD